MYLEGGKTVGTNGYSVIDDPLPTAYMHTVYYTVMT